jgi:hypothetical protein
VAVCEDDFLNLQTLVLSDNAINEVNEEMWVKSVLLCIVCLYSSLQWSAIDELDRLSHLEILKFRNNPLTQGKSRM